MTDSKRLLTIEISIQDQLMRLTYADEIIDYSISTAKLGIGQQKGSNQTPLGWQGIRKRCICWTPSNR
jgi:hypothetical protein